MRSLDAMTSSTHTAPSTAETSAADSDVGMFGPQSVTWRVHADPMMLVGGLRALFLQALHPEAMSRVARYSTFREAPWHRLWNTADFIGVTTFGATAQVEAAAARLRRIHARIPGANDPQLQLWIHCCEVDSFLTATRRAGLRLTDAEADRYLHEQLHSAALVGLRRSDVPADVGSLRAYFDDVRPMLALTPEAREAARYLFIPPMPGWVRTLTPARGAWAGAVGVAFGLLPGWARRLYRLPGLPTTDPAATAAARALRLSLLLIPETLRTGPVYQAAQRRVRSIVADPTTRVPS